MATPKKYLVNIEGDRIEVGIPDFYEKNQGLAITYKSEPKRDKKSEIAHKLMTMCEPVFMSWRIFNDDDREDFNQDCFLLTVMALESWNEGKGAFLSWLKRYAQGRRSKAINSHYRNPRSLSQSLDDSEGELYQPWNENQVEEQDLPMDMKRIKKLVSPERWKVLKLRIIDGMKKTEIAKELGISVPTVTKRLVNGYKAIRNGITISDDEQSMATLFDDGSIVIRGSKLAYILDIHRQQLRKMSTDKSDTLYRINPDHILRIGNELRYRYRIGPKGLVYPEIFKRVRKSAKPKE